MISKEGGLTTVTMITVVAFAGYSFVANNYARDSYNALTSYMTTNTSSSNQDQRNHSMRRYSTGIVAYSVAIGNTPFRQAVDQYVTALDNAYSNDKNKTAWALAYEVVGSMPHINTDSLYVVTKVGNTHCNNACVGRIKQLIQELRPNYGV